MTRSAEVVICGAGIAGIATAYTLTVDHGIHDVVIVDDLPPLTLTSDKSTECYRNWWPGPGDAMVALMNRSIDILEELAERSDNRFGLNRRGYLYASARLERRQDFERAATEAANLGAGPVRHHVSISSAYQPAPAHGYEHQPTGSDLMLDSAVIRSHFGYLAEDTVALVHARRCGWFNAQQLGMYLLERAREHGARLVPARMIGMETPGNSVRAVRLSNGETISTGKLVLAAGPYMRDAARLMRVDVPMFCERHIKIMFDDYLGVVPRNAPLLIWTDPVRLPWTDEERQLLGANPELSFLLEEFPAGVHTRPEGGADSRSLLILWTYDAAPVEPTFPIPLDLHYPEIALRGLSRMIPGLAAYFRKSRKPVMDGGYYAKTRENRPLVGPLPVKGAYIIGALSGFGLMAACGAADLLALHLTGGLLPRFAPAFHLDRYTQPEYQRLLANWSESGQL